MGNEKKITGKMQEKKNKVISTTNKMAEFFNRTVHLPYYYVKECPVCGSRETGRFIRYHRDTDMDYIITSSLKNGELVAPREDMSRENLFCNECGYTWYGSVQMKFLSLKKIKEEKIARHTFEILEERMEALKEEKGHKRNVISRFIGKL